MEKVLKDSRLLIIILFVFLTLPFNVEAKGYNWTILEWNIDKAEFISGDETVEKHLQGISVKDATPSQIEAVILIRDELKDFLSDK